MVTLCVFGLSLLFWVGLGWVGFGFGGFKWFWVVFVLGLFWFCGVLGCVDCILCLVVVVDLRFW